MRRFTSIGAMRGTVILVVVKRIFTERVSLPRERVDTAGGEGTGRVRCLRASGIIKGEARRLVTRVLQNRKCHPTWFPWFFGIISPSVPHFEIR